MGVAFLREKRLGGKCARARGLIGGNWYIQSGVEGVLFGLDFL